MTIIEIIKKDISLNKHILFPFGRISKVILQKELAKYDFEIPQNLINIWEEFGGGDFFETETIFYPLMDKEKENVHEVNDFCYSQGLPNRYFIFNTGMGDITAIDKQTGKIVNLKRETWKVENSYNSFEEWFHSIRKELVDRYI